LLHFYQPGLISLDEIKESSGTVMNKSKLDSTFESNYGNVSSLLPAIRPDLFDDVDDEKSFLDGKWSRTYSPGKIELLNETVTAGDRHNFRLAMTGFSRLGGVPLLLDSADIVGTIPDEKVVVTLLAFMCARLLVLRAETQAAMKIQYAWRTFCAKRGFGRLRDAVLTIQRAFRRSKNVREARKMQTAAIVLQRTARGWAARKKFRRTRLAVRTIQSFVQPIIRRKIAVKELCIASLLQRGLDHYSVRQSNIAATRIQAMFRMVKASSCFRRLRSATVTAQACWRRTMCQSQYLRLKSASVCLQKNYRAITERRRFLELKHAAVALQALVRGRNARQAYQQLQHAVLLTQKNVRRFLASRSYADLRQASRIIKSVWSRYCLASFASRSRQWMDKRIHAVTLIQATFRGAQQLKTFRSLKNASICMQSYWRRVTAIRQLQQLKLETLQRQSAITLQCFWRRTRAEKILADLKDAKLRLDATICIQSHWRRLTATRLLETLKVARARCIAATTIQAWRRGSVVRREYLSLRRASIVLQSYSRMATARRSFAETRRAAITIQAGIRKSIAVKNFAALKQAAIVVQKNVRVCQQIARQWLARRRLMELRVAALRKLNLTRLVQRVWRQRMARHQLASTVISSVWRMYVQRQSFAKQRTAAVALQSMFRGLKAVRAFAQMKKSAIVIQKQVRMIHQLRRFNAIRKGVLTIQRQARVMMAKMALQRLRVEAFRSRTLIRRVQLRYKARFAAKMHAASTIQRYWNGLRNCRRPFMALRSATILVQKSRKALVARREFLVIVRSAVIIQSSWKQVIQQRAFARARAGIIKIQSHVRAMQASTKFRQMKHAALAISHRRRATLAARQQRSLFSSLRLAVLTLQARFRLRQSVHAVTKIQSFWRMHTALVQKRSALASISRLQAQWRMIEARREFQAQRSALIFVQQIWRAKCELRHLRFWNGAEMKQRKADAAAVIINAIRTIRQRREYLKTLEAAKTIQATWRGHLVRRTDGKRKQNMRMRIRAAHLRAIQHPHMRLGNRTASALSSLLATKQLTTVMQAVASLAVTANLSRSCCDRMVEQDIVPIMLRLVQTCNRSQPHIELLKHVLQILISLAQHDSCAGRVLEAQDAVDIIAELMQTFRDKEDVFYRAALVLVMLSRKTATKEQAKTMTLNGDLIRRASAILSILERKQNLQKRTGVSQMSAQQQQHQKTHPTMDDCMDMMRRLLEELKSLSTKF
jgi:abnormal spindle-like microcephaly-associated protein